MNPNLSRLQPYPFAKLAQLHAGAVPPPLVPINLSIGEPRSPAPALVAAALIDALPGLSAYPTTQGGRALRQAIAAWLEQRFALPSASLDIERQILPVAGTREALFAFAQAVIHPAIGTTPPLVLLPNPFYQIYEGAALLAGATPGFIACTPASNWLPDWKQVSAADWQRCQLLYLCSPGNPTGAVLDLATLQHLIALADRYDFIIAADECYAEIYADEQQPPPGLLQACSTLGRNDYRRCVVFHSLSKRSNCPGLRSGFVAGDADILAQFYLYRTYQGCALPLHVQAASAAAWRDEVHVRSNRDQYRAKFAAVLEILQPVLSVVAPPAGFYLWPETPISDTDFAYGLFAQQHVSVLPGSFLSRSVAGYDPGARRVRLALVASLDDCVEAAQRIRRYVANL